MYFKNNVYFNVADFDTCLLHELHCPMRGINKCIVFHKLSLSNVRSS